VSAHRSAITRYLPLERNTTATTRSYPITVCRKTRKLGITDHHHLCILIQVLVRFLLGSYRREYRPLRNHYPHYTFTRYPLPSTNLSRIFADPLPFRNTLRTVTDPLPISMNSIPTRYKLSLTCYTLYGRGILLTDASRFTTWRI
jgi:hypothetical protein